jgi:hypothetical protein
MRKALFIYIAIFGLVYCGRCLAKDVNFEASVDSNVVSIGEGTRLGLTFYGTQDVPAPDIKEIDGFEIRYIGPSKMMSIVNGRVSSSVTHNYKLLPLKAGSFEIGPFSFEFKGNRYTSNKITVKVIEGPRSPQEEAAAPQGTPDLTGRIFLVLSAGKTSAYINELIPLKLKLYVYKLAVRDIQFPSFTQEGFSKADFQEPKQYREVLNGKLFDVIEFNTRIFGTKTGEFKVGPAETTCNIVVRRTMRRRGPFSDDDFFGESAEDSFFEDFFSRYERYPMALKSKELAVNVLPLPKEGAPKDFAGTVGNFQFVVDANPRDVRVGDPITLKMAVYGEGNFNTILPPKFADTKDFKIYEPQSKTEDNRKVFEQVLIPEDSNVKEIPKVSFSFFNPQTGIYRTISHGPIPITVQKAPEGARPRIVESALSAAVRGEPAQEALGRDIIYIKDSPGALVPESAPLYKNKAFLALQILPLVFLLTVVAVHARRERLRSDKRYARLLRAPKTARRGLKEARRYLNDKKAAEFYDAVFTTLKGYLGDKFHLPTGGITASIIDETLKPRGFDEDLLSKLKGLFDECDMARYAPSGIDAEKMRNSFESLKCVIAYFERAHL